MSHAMFPNIVTNINGHDQSTNILSFDFEKNRIIYINGEVNDLVALSVISHLRYLDAKSDEDITLIINCPGGSVTAGMAIYDCMKHGIHCDVVTIATGMAASMGAFLLAAGTKGKRYATNNAEIMIHQPLGGVQGQATDISLVADHIQYIKKKLASILAEECGKTQKKLMHDTERDNWMSSAAAKEYGLIDHVGYPNENMEVRYDY